MFLEYHELLSNYWKGESMNDLYICNGLSNYISKINLTDSIHQKIHLEDENKIIGIHGIDF